MAAAVARWQGGYGGKVARWQGGKEATVAPEVAEVTAEREG